MIYNKRELFIVKIYVKGLISINHNDLVNISKYIEKNFAIYFSIERYTDLKRIILNTYKELNVKEEDFINSIVLNKLSSKDKKILIQNLTIGETYFFRDKNLFSVIKNFIFPEVIKSKGMVNKKLKIWSAGCSSGEEAYSIGITLKEVLKDYNDWNIEIIATDVNDTSLKKAKKGIYSEWSFRDVEYFIKNKYFLKHDDAHYKIKDEIIKKVSFYNLNLAKDDYFLEDNILKDIDIIFCRHVLMYFSEKQICKIIDKFFNALKEDGYLIVSPVENFMLNGSKFEVININNSIFHKKISIEDTIFKFNTIKKESDNFLNVYNYKSSFENNDFKVNDKNVIENNSNDFCNEKDFAYQCRKYANEGDLSKAIELCEKVISIDKVNPYYYVLSTIEQERENIEEAIKILKKVIYLDSKFIIAYFDLGNLYLRLEKITEANKYFKILKDIINPLKNEDIVPYSDEINIGTLKKFIVHIK